ncbi:hypothetical protein [Bradyrhizobium stylosanthis]|uniref:Uncharacterized protein n=1 Tax=Bradyrhizobium stylosanthis TaxID=1803665 RepID=A0A560DPG8_9BRAD|nr:hypothetical protein [Bradyrhizobium stylosanthis]TWA99023.1 hypothetical protein FBZ96_105703 [Bradyrhizobium stylosanthis]
MARAKKIMEATTDPLDAMLASAMPCWRDCSSPVSAISSTACSTRRRANLSTRETLILLCEREIARSAF